MFNIFSLKHQFARLMDADDDGSAGGAAVDRGDTLSAGAPALDDTAKADVAAEAERIRAEAAAAAAAAAKPGEVDPNAPLEGETAEETAARVAAAGDDKKGKAAMIPVERHKAMLDKAREERDSLAAQLAQQAKGREIVETNAEITKVETAITAKETEYNAALIAGEVEKAGKLMTEIRAMERGIGDLRADMRAQVAETRAVERVRYDTTVERLEAAYDQLNPEHESFDKAQVAEVMDLKAAYETRGMAPSAALQKAVKLIMGAETTKQKTAANTTARVSAEDAAAATAAAAAEAKRTEEATRKALDAAGKTPPSAAKVGVDSDKLGGGQVTADMVMKMDQGKFAKLDEDTLARLRGDAI